MTTDDTFRSSEVRIAADLGAELPGLLTLPQPAFGVVICMWEGAACQTLRASALERALIERLHAAGFASLLLHPLSATREDLAELPPRARIELITDDLVTAISWLLLNPDTQPLNIGCVACGDSVVAALLAAARTPEHIDAIVSVRGLFELAEEELDKVRAPTLFMAEAGAAPSDAVSRIRTDKTIKLLPHEDFDRELPLIACRWFERHLLAGGHSFAAS